MQLVYQKIVITLISKNKRCQKLKNLIHRFLNKIFNQKKSLKLMNKAELLIQDKARQKKEK